MITVRPYEGLCRPCRSDPLVIAPMRGGILRDRREI